MQRRRGFSLVELLVATALIAFILVILAEAFKTATDSVRLLKAQGSMQDKLRATTTVMKADLRADHFIGNGARLSDQDLSRTTPPTWGFFRIWQGSPPSGSNPYYTDEGIADGIHSYRSADHILHFTMRDRNGNWWVVSYFLRPNGDNAGTTPLYSLYREQIAVPMGATRQAAPSVDVTLPTNRLSLVSPTPIPVTTPPTPPVTVPMMQPSDPNNPNSAYGLPKLNPGFPTYPTFADVPAIANDPAVGDDLVLADVISFEVEILSPQSGNSAGFVHLFDPSLDASRNQNIPAFYLPPTGTSQGQSGPAVFDTWTQQGLPVGKPSSPGGPPSNVIVQPPLQIRVTAIQVTLRVWDASTQQTRQISFIQAM